MKALSIRQPFPWAIMAGIKPVENRTWSTAYRGPLAIHAGVAWYENEEFGIGDINHWVGRYQVPPHEEFMKLGGIVGIVDLIDVVTDHPSEFFFGPYGFALANPRPCKFVPMKGRLGLFDVPDHLIEVLQ